MIQKSEKNVGLADAGQLGQPRDCNLARIYADFTTLPCKVGFLVILRELKA